ncbi:hypothetical protein B0T25DRAFT_462365 [Lasiosphaeria hispida]|uniref:DnaJ-domain-containing protein n=1 Tax=Lasiosphaeria hispida TaxID=260671 RepID=A0AAJ0HAV9_9PEZI|nr:hypothetical protein B0T25DRAFT_462365 [Lasiosphaeria hispida]
MGAEQSSARSGRQLAVAVVRKTCYYEVLGVDRQVADDEIRKAYKKKALELHPDRNLNDTENATRKFAEVQTAYEILSDPQERAWYDTHRDAILGGDPDAGGAAPSDVSGSQYTSAITIFSLMGRFNSSVPMNDSPSGFFGILNAFFDQLASEEAAACEWDGGVPADYPPFGDAKDGYDSVAKPFYVMWSGFATKKSFSWKDKYRLAEAPDRRVRRLMEKENKKFREEGIREFNDAVQSLVAFVKKRDPRYVPNTQSEAERQKILRNSAATQAARSRAAYQEKLARYTVPEWAQSRNDGAVPDEFSLSEEESEVEHIECVVCNKIFKSEKQFEAHEKSKKHTKAVQQLQRQMKRENADFDLEDEGRPSKTSDLEEGGEELGDTADGEENDSRPLPIEKEGEQEEKRDEEDNKKQNTPSRDDTDDNDEYAPRSTIEDRLLPGKKPPTESLVGDEDIVSAATSVDNLALDDGFTSKKVGKAKLKREKRAARQAVGVDAQESHNCAVCSETFKSRSKLFSHIKELDHVAPVPKAKAGKKRR